MSTQCHCPAPSTVVPFGSINLVVHHGQDGQNQQGKPQCPMEEQFLSLKKEIEDALSLTETKPIYQLCEFYSFRNPQKKKGFELAYGELLENAVDLYPEAWAFLQTDEGKALCVTEDEWQAMNHATWATLADGKKIGFDGIGGVTFYVQDLDAGTLRLPDIRGMVVEASGFDGLSVGGVHGDMERNITGMCKSGKSTAFLANAPSHETKPKGLFYYGPTTFNTMLPNTIGKGHELAVDSSRVVPTGNANKPRAFGVLPCVYLGNSK